MNLPTILIGVVALVFGGYTAYVRATNPTKFGKLAAMKQQWGEKPGAVIHLIAYTVIPIIMGGVLIVVGFRGVSLIGQ